MDGKKIILGMVCSFMLNGCLLTVGYDQTYCEENGADYSDAGVCGDPMEIYENRHALAAASNRKRCVKK